MYILYRNLVSTIITVLLVRGTSPSLLKYSHTLRSSRREVVYTGSTGRGTLRRSSTSCLQTACLLTCSTLRTHNQDPRVFLNFSVPHFLSVVPDPWLWVFIVSFLAFYLWQVPQTCTRKLIILLYFEKVGPRYPRLSVHVKPTLPSPSWTVIVPVTPLITSYARIPRFRSLTLSCWVSPSYLFRLSFVPYLSPVTVCPLRREGFLVGRPGDEEEGCSSRRRTDGGAGLERGSGPRRQSSRLRSRPWKRGNVEVVLRSRVEKSRSPDK